MSKQLFSFKIPLSRFDVGLLPLDARKVGSDKFKSAVTMHFATQYAAKGQNVIVTVDETEISVQTLPEEMPTLDFVLPLLQSGRIQEALPYLESMVKAAPDDVQILYNLGISYSELGQFDEAIIRLKRAVKLDPNHIHAWNGIGVAYQRLRKPELAIEATRKAVELDPVDGYGQRNLGAMLLGQGHVDEALKHLREARRSLPHDEQTTYGLANALVEVGGDDNLLEADELYVVVIKRWPGSQIAELARQARTQLAQRSMRANVGGGIRPDVMMYMVGALDTFKTLGPDKTKQVTLEIALKGQSGLDINDSEQKYTLKTLPGNFSGLHLVSMMHVGMRTIDPNIDTGLDFKFEYEAALAMRK